VTESDRRDGRSLLPLASDSIVEWRGALLSAGATGSQSLRTAQWCLRTDAAPPLPEQDANRSQGLDELAAELYVRPDDHWEANNVAKLCPDAVATLAATIK
jgi:hypothetical protein